MKIGIRAAAIAVPLLAATMAQGRVVEFFDFEKFTDGTTPTEGKSFYVAGAGDYTTGALGKEGSIIGTYTNIGPTFTKIAAIPGNGFAMKVVPGAGVSHQDTRGGRITSTTSPTSPLFNWGPLEWTIECAARCDNDGDWRTFLSRCSSGESGGGDIYVQRVKEGFTDNTWAPGQGDLGGRFSCKMKTQGGDTVVVYTSADFKIAKGIWNGFAVTSDGVKLTLYIDKNDGNGYRFAGQSTFPADKNNAMVGGDKFWTIGEGVWGVNHWDPSYVLLDNIRFHDVCLEADELYDQFPPPPFEITAKTPGPLSTGVDNRGSGVDIIVEAKEVTASTVSSYTMKVDDVVVTPVHTEPTSTNHVFTYKAVGLSNGVPHKVFIQLNGATANDVVTDEWTFNVFKETADGNTVLKHHWDFEDGSGTTVEDKVGNKDGTVVGTGFQWLTPIGSGGGGGSLYLGGGTNSGAFNTNDISGLPGAYVDLPDGTISAIAGAATFEILFRDQGSPQWSRVYDFGRSETNAGLASAAGSNYFMLTTKDLNNTINSPFTYKGNNNQFFELDDNAAQAPSNSLTHVVISYDPTATPRRAVMFVNGKFVDADINIAASNSVTFAQLQDLNNWIGRSQYSGDNLWRGEILDFKIHTGVMTYAQALANWGIINSVSPGIPYPPEIGYVGITNSNRFVIEYTAANVGVYTIQRKTSLTGVWTDLTNGIGSGNKTIIVPMTPGAAQEFYRVKGDEE